ncbi:hypothetical protein SAMN05192556_1094 [Halomonas caseinilytica]|uniref:Uncharacterized protein n=1 Tax=Halomonas caseinilytica TaxID=438744 RepID=A0A1M6YKS3_9GAMM|nr:hypothetical protein SAMN05192556_1094 [Halomonas caseinilytica]
MVTRSLEPRKPASCQVAPCGAVSKSGSLVTMPLLCWVVFEHVRPMASWQWNLTTSRLSAVGTRGYAIEQVAVHHGAMPIG